MKAELELLARLRELAAVDPEALIGRGPDAEGSLAAFVEDLHEALAAARQAIAALQAEWRGPDPLLFIDAPVAARTSEKGREALTAASRRLAAQAQASRRQAALTEAAARLLLRFGEAERRHALLP